MKLTRVKDWTIKDYGLNYSTKITKNCRDLPLYILKPAIRDQTMQNKNFDKRIYDI